MFGIKSKETRPVGQIHRYNAELNFYDCELIGPVTNIEPLIDAGRKLAKMAETTGCRRYLNDMRRTRFEVPPEDLIRLVEAHSRGGVGEQGWKRALLIDKMDPLYQLYEIATANRQSDLRLFTDRDEALRWLLD
jgi:hypothetical protein